MSFDLHMVWVKKNFRCCLRITNKNIFFSKVGIMVNPVEQFKVSASATAFKKDPLNYLSSAIPKGFIIAAQVSILND